MLELPEGLKIVRDVETDELLLSDFGYIIAKFVPSSMSWEKERGWLAKPGETNSVNENLVMSITSGIMPTSYHSTFHEKLSKYDFDKNK